ncbi:MAG: NAD(P)H-dependent glycerol-3-phosphate dehydrogenase, partial [Bacteroidota bacterium]|nr:NAD(P)H-dependent glycerol-3-phosphate dehydrogenase [Bacteroidota bacterium]
MNPTKKIGLIGNGSWATAILKLLSSKDNEIYWYLKKTDDIEYFQKNKRNPRYLRQVEFDISKIKISNDINEVTEKSEILYFIIPSAFLDSYLSTITTDLSNKIIVSGIKGIVPSTNLLFAEHFAKEFNVQIEDIATIAGPSHAEEVAMCRLTYLTIASKNLYNAEIIANQLENQNLRTYINDDIYGIEYTAVLKNIYALAVGICNGLGFGDNFTAVLVSNAILEAERFINTVNPRERNISNTAYLGDLLGTAYSKFSRNRTFGIMIGKGYSVSATKLEMNMIAEGYYAVESFHKINAQYNIYMPILEAVYNILYDNKPAGF